MSAELYRPAKRRHIPAKTIVHYGYRPKLTGKRSLKAESQGTTAKCAMASRMTRNAWNPSDRWGRIETAATGNLSGDSLIANYIIYGSGDFEVDAVADASPLEKSSVADVAETDPHRSLPQGILKCWIGRLARRLAGRFRSGRPYAVKIAAVTFVTVTRTCCGLVVLILQSIISPSLGWLRQCRYRYRLCACGFRVHGPSILSSRKSDSACPAPSKPQG